MSTNQTKVYCGQCKWWDNPGGGTHYPCRRHCPEVISTGRVRNELGPSGPGIRTEWPITTARDWCGDGELSVSNKQAEFLEELRLLNAEIAEQQKAYHKLHQVKPKKRGWLAWLFRRTGGGGG